MGKRLLTYKGRTQGMSEWARELGLNYYTLRSRLNLNGWPVKNALEQTLPRGRKPHKTHGMSETRPYTVWNCMKRRCLNKNDQDYQRYGGRGITVCPKWIKFENFWEDMKDGYEPHLEIDRIDNDGNYCKENCKWSTRKEQLSNTSKSRKLTFNGKTMTVEQWAEHLNVPRERIRDRIDRLGWTVERALTEPKKGVPPYTPSDWGEEMEIRKYDNVH